MLIIFIIVTILCIVKKSVFNINIMLFSILRIHIDEHIFIISHDVVLLLLSFELSLILIKKVVLVN